MRKIILFFLIMACFSVTALFAVDGENLTVKVALIGPGDEVNFWWGHIALVIEDSNTGQSRFFDYGIFSFDQDNFFVNFALGRLYFFTGVSSTARNIAVYSHTNRSVIFYTLNLPPETRLEVLRRAEHDVLPENSLYLYHHFNNNCSTPIRDIINDATGGQFYEMFGNMPSRFTLRQHVRRHTWFCPFMDWILNFWMGQGIDTPITVWDAMFLPSEVTRYIQDFYFTDIHGERRRLVESEASRVVIVDAYGRPEVLDIPRTQWPRQLVFSLMLSAVFGAFFYMYSKNIRAGRVLAGISISFCGLIFGIAALMLYFLVLFTDHDYTFRNLNMIFATPLLLVLVPAGLSFAFTKNAEKIKKYDELIRIIWLLTVLGIIISMVLNLLPWFFHDNLTDQMLMLPLALLFAFQPVGLKRCIDKYFNRKPQLSESN